MQFPSFPRLPITGIVFSLLLSSGVVFPGKEAVGQIAPSGVGPFRTQTIALKAGWNAVYLEVEPLDSNPTALFADTPIEIVAAYFRPVSTMEFIENPGQLISNRENWSVWYAPDRDDALLSNLFAIQAHQGYLINVEEDYTWNVKGAPTLGTTRWHPNTYSLVGFQIEASEKPTMASFFANSPAQTPLKIYHMVDGRWALVTEPASTLLEPGRAYWAYSEGASDYSGPLEVTLDTGSQGGLLYTETSGARRLVIRNLATHPQTLSFDLSAGNAGLLPMAYEVTVLNGSDESIKTVTVPLPESFELGPLESGQAFALDLQVNQDLVSQPFMSVLLTIRTDAGMRRQIPIVSIRRDLIE